MSHAETMPPDAMYSVMVITASVSSIWGLAVFSNITNGQIRKLSRLFALICTDSVFTTRHLELGEPISILTLHLEMSRNSDSLDDFFSSFNNIHHATGILADQLVRSVMLDAAAAVENNYMRVVAAD